MHIIARVTMSNFRIYTIVWHFQGGGGEARRTAEVDNGRDESRHAGRRQLNQSESKYIKYARTHTTTQTSTLLWHQKLLYTHITYYTVT